MGEGDYRPVRNELGFYSVEPMPTNDERREFYEKKYYQEGYGCYRTEYDEEELAYIFSQPKVARHLMKELTGLETGRVLDAGCGQGFFAAFFAENGWDVAATDFSHHGIETHNPQLEDVFLKGDLLRVLDELQEKGERFDLVNLHGVLEHLVDPGGILGLAQGVLQDGGVLRVAVPNDYSDFQRMLLERGVTDESWFVPPEHLHYFSFDSLKALVDASGFKTRRVLGDFPIELFLLNEHSNYNADRSKGKAAHRARIAAENYLLEMGLDKYVAYYEAAAKASLGRQAIVFAQAA